MIFFLTLYFSWMIFPGIFFRGWAKVKDVASKLLKVTGALTASSRGSGSEADVWGVVSHPGGGLLDCVFPMCPFGLVTWTGL